MTIGEFWNQAFLAALSRLPAEQAKAEADLAMQLTIEHWKEVRKKRGNVVPPTDWVLYANLDIANISDEQR